MDNPQFCFRDTTFHGPSLLRDRRDVVYYRTVRTQLQQLRETGRYDCFKLQWHPVYDDPHDWPVPKSLFWDSDVAKWIEGACYFLDEKKGKNGHDKDGENNTDIQAAIDELVCDIRSAQQSDGYLNVYYSVVEPDAKARWSNIRDRHELYNAGHLIEAALAHHIHYGNNALLEPIQKYVRLLCRVFGPGPDQRHAYPGHPEIELALLRLFRATGDVAARDLAQYFLQERGNPAGQDGTKMYFDWEAEQRGEKPHQRPNTYPEARSHWYNQAHAPILDQTTVEGHAVRAMYLLTGVADMVNLAVGEPMQPWKDALRRLWDNMVDCKMSMTGGIGAVKQWEGFGADFFLPQGTDEGGCYNETCASIGVLMLAERLLQSDLCGKYGDIMELCLYNTILGGMDLRGESFAYVNQLASSPADKNERHSWFEVACCPPNLMRLFGCLGGYLWDYGGEDLVDGGNAAAAFVNVHLYTTATVSFAVSEQQVPVELTQTTDWPRDGRIEFSLKAPTAVKVTIRLRIPGWAQGEFILNPPMNNTNTSNTKPNTQNGYLVLPPEFTAQNPIFFLTIGGFAPRFVAPHPYTQQDTLTLMRGPLVYCVEDVDNVWAANHFKDVCISHQSAVEEQWKAMDSYDDSGKQQHPYWLLKTTSWERQIDKWWSSAGILPGATPSRRAPVDRSVLYGPPRELFFVPYYLRANRGGKGHMRVGLMRKE